MTAVFHGALPYFTTEAGCPPVELVSLLFFGCCDATLLVLPHSP